MIKGWGAELVFILCQRNALFVTALENKSFSPGSEHCRLNPEQVWRRKLRRQLELSLASLTPQWGQGWGEPPRRLGLERGLFLPSYLSPFLPRLCMIFCSYYQVSFILEGVQRRPRRDGGWGASITTDDLIVQVQHCLPPELPSIPFCLSEKVTAGTNASFPTAKEKQVKEGGLGLGDLK